MRECVTHHMACACREAEFAALRERVATLEGAMRDHADCRICSALLDVSHDQEPRHHDCGGGLCEQYGVLCDGCAEADPNADIALGHQRHYRQCDCLADSARCCQPACACHDQDDGQERDR